MIRVLLLFFAAPGIWPFGAEGEVRRVLSEYMAAVRQGGPRQLEFLSKSYRVFLTHGHVFDRPPGFNPDQPRGQSRSQFIVSMHFPRPDIAVVAANWHDGSAMPPFDSGLADYTLLREDGSGRLQPRGFEVPRVLRAVGARRHRR